mmetsp:Transcript_49134/g.159674  ORF Transcript_49134/g.159674 Transcript_49134/m.159674 type:complete len:202 (-) Transcript_49134:1201-1806(-)
MPRRPRPPLPPPPSRRTPLGEERRVPAAGRSWPSTRREGWWRWLPSRARRPSLRRCPRCLGPAPPPLTPPRCDSSGWWMRRWAGAICAARTRAACLGARGRLRSVGDCGTPPVGRAVCHCQRLESFSLSPLVTRHKSVVTTRQRRKSGQETRSPPPRREELEGCGLRPSWSWLVRRRGLRGALLAAGIAGQTSRQTWFFMC